MKYSDWVVVAFVLGAIVGISARFVADMKAKQDVIENSATGIKESLTPFERDRREVKRIEFLLKSQMFHSQEEGDMKYQQGDVIIKGISAIPASAGKLSHRILAEGEATGHAHRADTATLYELGGVLYLHCDADCTVTHEEHAAVTLPAGDYQIGIVREYDPFTEEARNVRD